MKKTARRIIIICVIIIFGGLGGILADRYLFPYLSTLKAFSKYDFLKKFTQDVTVINKTEQIYVKEETSLSKITDAASSSVVNVISIPKPSDQKAYAAKGQSAKPAVRNGAGLIATSDGLIMTHREAIIPQDASYKILTGDGSAYDGELAGIDAFSDIAFIKISASNLPVASFANSDDSKPGEKIVAIGNNLADYQDRYAGGLLGSFDPSYNLSGKSLNSSDKLEGVFLVDLNLPENFVGGPVVDYTGQIIGLIGTLERDNAREFFAIPSNKLKAIIDRAINKSLDQDIQLGIYYLPLTKTYALANGINVKSGAVIFSPSGQQGLAIIAGSAAQKAGLEINDIITAVNGQEIKSGVSLPDLLYQFKKGDQAELSVIRGTEMKKITVNF